MAFLQGFLGRQIRRCAQMKLAHAPLYLSLILAACAPFAVAQSSITYDAAYDFKTPNAWSSYFNSHYCFAPACLYLPSPGGTGQVDSSDYAVGQGVWMAGLANGETVSWKFTTPTGSVQTIVDVTYNQPSDCFVVSDGIEYCGTHDYLGLVVVGIVNSCEQPYSLKETGLWSISTYDGANLEFTNSFQISRNPSGIVGITSPTDNQLFQLTQDSNYKDTGNITFSAGTNTGQPINWVVNLHYQSSGGYPNPSTDPAAVTFQGASYTYSGFQAMGGQMKVVADVTASDGSTVGDCVTAYVEGPETGIPDAAITARLDQLYPASSSYIQYLNDGTATPDLLAKIAMHESSYQQFQTPAENNPNSDLFQLYATYGIAAKWPKENLKTDSIPRGAHIGLMQVPTTDPDAWDWTVNTQTGTNTFNDKVQDAVRYEGYIINGYTDKKTKVSLPAHVNGDGSYLNSLTGYDRENNALVLYNGAVGCSSISCTVGKLYYIPQCPSPGTQVTDRKGDLVCQGGTWQWVTNTANQPVGIEYVNKVRNP